MSQMNENTSLWPMVEQTSIISSTQPQQLQSQIHPDMDFSLQIMKFYNETREFEQKVGIIIPSIFALVIAVGLVGNLLVIVVALNRQMRNSTNTLIIGLTCSDLMFLTLCVPFTAIDYAFPIWVLPTWSCNVINYLQHSSAYFSVWTLTLMAGDRFLAVCFPVESMTLRSPKNTLIALVTVYSAILLSQIQVGRIHDVYNYTFVLEERSACSIVSIAKGEATVIEARLYFFSFNIFGYFVPLGITCVFYYFMLRRLWYSPCGKTNKSTSVTASSSTASAATAGANGGNSSFRSARPETIRAKKKVTRLVLCVVVIWALCWLPLNVCFFFSGLVYPDTLVLRGGKPAVIIQIASQVLAYTNSCLNPILYPLVSENFRKGFLRIICLIINWVTCGRYCKKSRLLYNSKMEVTFYRSNSQKMSRTNSRTTSSHRNATIGSSNQQNTFTGTSTMAQEMTSTSLHPFNRSSLPSQRLSTTSIISTGGGVCGRASIISGYSSTGGCVQARLLSRGDSALLLRCGPPSPNPHTEGVMQFKIPDQSDRKRRASSRRASSRVMVEGGDTTIEVVITDNNETTLRDYDDLNHRDGDVTI